MTHSIKEKARLSLAVAEYDPKKLALIHTGISVALSLSVSLISYLLGLGIADTGGLAGIGSRAVLSSAQSVLNFALALLLPFWELGFLYAALGLARQEKADFSSLAQGFRCFPSAMRLFLIQTLLAVSIFTACTYAAYTIFTLTPFFESTYNILAPIAEAGGEVVLEEATIQALLPTLIPMYVILAALVLLVGAPMFYRYRMAQFALLDGAAGARRSMAESIRIMQRNRITLFKLDLSFWWYYGLQLILVAVAYADVLLPTLGVTLPISSTLAYWLFYGIYMGLRLLVAWKFAAYIQTAYAHCYDTFRQYAPSPSTLPQSPDGTPKE